MISAHWIHDPIGITTGKLLATVHDLVGFPEELYALQYPAKGNDALSMNIAQRLQAHGITNKLEGQRGLDHGIGYLCTSCILKPIPLPSNPAQF